MAEAMAASVQDEVSSYLGECRVLVLDEIRAIVPRDVRHSGRLYDLMLDYPLRGGKALRPALCIAACRALGGHLEAVLRSAAVLELYHNAFLVHDDVEDGSEKRRTEDTLHRQHGVPIAVNVGDGMLAITMQPLLDNIELIGLGRSLRILRVVARMARESAEGQMMELDWIHRADWSVSDGLYVRMVYKKTSWYSFIAPISIGAIAAGAKPATIARLGRFATRLGIAFQIQDDVLNLVANEADYGKEIDGDLWEGKHTLILIHALRCATASERERAVEILAKPRPSLAVEVIRHGAEPKSADEVAFLRQLIDRYGSVSFAWSAASARALRASRSFRALSRELPSSVHLDFMSRLVDFVIQRDH